jgi:membrane protease YdiL (CAAX protease family)
MSAVLYPSDNSAGLRNGAIERTRPAPPSGLRVLAVLARLAWRRLYNRISAGVYLTRRKSTAEAEATAPRTATPGKRVVNVLLTLFIVAIAVLGSVLLGAMVVARLTERLSPTPVAEVAAAPTNPAAAEQAEARQGRDDIGRGFDRLSSGEVWNGSAGDRPVTAALGLFLLLLGLAQLTFLLGSGTQELGAAEWDLEWLFTFPVPAPTLFLARLVQGATVGQILLWFQAPPFLVMVYVGAGFGWWAIPLAVAATAVVALVNASAALVVETWARKRLAPGRRKNLQAVLAIAAQVLALLFCAIEVTPHADGLVEAAANWLPVVVAAGNPWSVPVALGAPGWGLAAVMAMGLLAVAVPFVSVRAAGWLVRDGLIVSSGAHQGSRGRRPAGVGRIGGWLRGVLAKELRLLVRDRAFLAQTLIAPVLVMGFWVLLRGGVSSNLAQDPWKAGAMAFGVGTYVLMFSAFQVLNAEGGALWLLYTFPQSLASVLRRKTLLWSGFAVAYALAALGIAAAAGMPVDGEAVVAGGLALAGVAIYAFIAAAMGTLAARPLEVDVQRRLRLDVMYGYLLLVTLYAGVFTAASAYSQAVVVILTALVAFALWQKVHDRLPYLLDPTEAPPPRVSMADGMIAALAYLVFQLVIAIILGHWTSLSPATGLLVASGAAGALVAVSALWFLRGVPDLLSVTGITAAPGARPGLWGALAPGVAGGGIAGLFGIAYIAAYQWLVGLPSCAEDSFAVNPLGWPAMLAFAVLVAPVVEEFLFRGLLYQGMRRSVRPALAVVGSALVFAIIHPPTAAVPVFVLGLATALTYRRSGLLVTSIVTHVVYNAMVTFAECMIRSSVP